MGNQCRQLIGFVLLPLGIQGCQLLAQVEQVFLQGEGGGLELFHVGLLLVGIRAVVGKQASYQLNPYVNTDYSYIFGEILTKSYVIFRPFLRVEVI